MYRNDLVFVSLVIKSSSSGELGSLLLGEGISQFVIEALPSYWKVIFPFTIIFCSCKEQKAHRVSLGQLPQKLISAKADS